MAGARGFCESERDYVCPAAEAVEGVEVAGDGQGAPAGVRAKRRLPDAEVQWILSRERREGFAPDMSGLPEKTVEVFRRGMEASKVLAANFAEYQDEVRAEYEAKGYVEVDDDLFEQREELRQWIRDELAGIFDRIDWSGVEFSDHFYAGLSLDDGDGVAEAEEDDDQEEGDDRERPGAEEQVAP